MDDLNDYIYFAEVVGHGGFAPAGRALAVPKSKLSRRVAALEARLGVRLIERSSRRFRVTEVGQALYEHCRAIVDELRQARLVAEEARGEPRGRVRFSCPHGLVEPLSASLADFLGRYPEVTLQVVATDRAVDLIAERIDVALRVRTAMESDAAMTVRTLTRSRRILVAAPAVAEALGGGAVDGLSSLPTLSSSDQPGEAIWHLVGEGGESHTVRHRPRFACEDFAALRAAAASGLGVALLPDHVCRCDLKSGRLVRLLPGWHAQEGIVHLVFTTRRGLPPAVRAFIDHLARAFGEGGVLAGD
jgi:DNA-binding transcriptional LysR family regulator